MAPRPSVAAGRVGLFRRHPLVGSFALAVPWGGPLLAGILMTSVIGGRWGLREMSLPTVRLTHGVPVDEEGSP